MSTFLRFDGASRHQPLIDEWFSAQNPSLAAIARPNPPLNSNITCFAFNSPQSSCFFSAAVGLISERPASSPRPTIPTR